MNAHTGSSPSIAFEQTLLPLRWGVSIISVGTLLVAGTDRIVPFFVLNLMWAVYILGIEWYLTHGRRRKLAVTLFPLLDGVFTITALVMVGGTLNPFTPLFSLTMASIAMRLPLRSSLPLSVLLLGALALGLHLVPDPGRLDWAFLSFAAFNLLIVWLVTHLMRNADRFRVSLDDVNSLLHHFPCGVIVEDERGLYANEYTLRSLRLPVSQGDATGDLATTEHARLNLLWQEVQRSTHDPRCDDTEDIAEVSIRFDDELMRTYYCRRLVLTLASGATAHVATLVDATREVEMQRRLQEQERLRLIGTLTAMAIHEVRNPLAAVRATAQLISLDRNAPTSRDHALRITAIIDELHTFLDRLMDLGRIPVEPATQCDSGTLLREVAALMTPLAHRKNVMMQIHDDVTDVSIAGDPYSLRQVLINLVQNGIDAMNEGGTITLRTSQEGRSVHIMVQDEGGGIPPNIASRIFDPFYTTKDKGTGLGLVISRQIIEEHQGRLWFETDDKGTTFHIVLPGVPVAESFRETS